ncbi:fumarylacetoacetate hydrolase family protein [Galbitalea sp. SE-J8]|uniref:fumarylacetoacetate hydrolase family protein n=1 Tax=Galbitalea sp. SE-J8 TaxID=3054952 RepID=UPI00259D1DE2|nr:fumarylacetoacetate hydrolase family protein [Galbitalea sp. SE-J8]MDM4763014.1 fumarylacetoacetate hydrolase family protein [Galbitalea sp. SE-J8]
MSHNGGPADRALPPQAFHKSARTLADPGDVIPIDSSLGTVNIEGELAVVIGRTARRLSPADVPEAILGYTIGNDVTAVDQIPLDNQLIQVKNGDGYTPIGPWIETDLDPTSVDIVVRIDGVERAASNTRLLAYGVIEQLVYLTRYLTLGPGDVVLTGAPGTFVAVLPGQRVDITLGGIGTLHNDTVAPRTGEAS